jgi:hypothetical protein
MRVAKVLPLFSLVLSLSAPAFAENPDAKEILRRATERHFFGFDEARMVFTMTLKNKRGEKKVRRLVSRSKKVDGLIQRHACFLGPDEVKNTAFLSVERKGGRDDQYLWLPGQSRLRRVSASQRGGSFMGSDFSYRDLERRSVDDEEHKILREESIGGHPCWVIESVPKPGVDDEYGRVETWVRKDNEFPIRTKLYDKSGQHAKTLFVREIGRIGSSLYSKSARMVDLGKRHSTYLLVEELETKADLSDEIFTPAYLGRGQECRP